MPKILLKVMVAWATLGVSLSAGGVELSALPAPDRYALCDHAVDYFRTVVIPFLPSQSEQDAARAWTEEARPYWREAASASFDSASLDEQWLALRRKYLEVYREDSQAAVMAAKAAGRDENQALMFFMRIRANECRRLRLQESIARIQADQERRQASLAETRQQLAQAQQLARVQQLSGRDKESAQDVAQAKERAAQARFADAWSVLPEAWPYLTVSRNPEAPVLTYAFSMGCGHCLHEISRGWPLLSKLVSAGKINLRLIHVQNPVAVRGKFSDHAIQTAQCVTPKHAMAVLSDVVNRILQSKGPDMGLRQRGWLSAGDEEQFDQILRSLHRDAGITLENCASANPQNYEAYVLAEKKMPESKAGQLPVMAYRGRFYHGSQGIAEAYKRILADAQVGVAP